MISSGKILGIGCWINQILIYVVSIPYRYCIDIISIQYSIHIVKALEEQKDKRKEGREGGWEGRRKE